MESDDLAWLRAGDGEGHFHEPGPWPFGITAYAGREDNDLILWLLALNAVVSGDTFSDFGEGLDVQLGGRKHVTRDRVVERLRPLLELPSVRGLRGDAHIHSASIASSGATAGG